MVLAFINLTLTILINKRISKIRLDVMFDDQNLAMNDMELQKKQLDTKKHQLSILAVGLFIYAVFFVMVTVISELVIFDSKAFK